MKIANLLMKKKIKINKKVHNQTKLQKRNKIKIYKTIKNKKMKQIHKKN